MFTKDFDNYVCPGDRITCEVDGFHCVATLHYDEDTKADDYYEGLDPVLVAWERDEWQYFGVAVTVWREGVKLTGEFDHALWGIEGNMPGDDHSYFRDVANEYLPEAIAHARAVIAKLNAA